MFCFVLCIVCGMGDRKFASLLPLILSDKFWKAQSRRSLLGREFVVIDDKGGSQYFDGLLDNVIISQRLLFSHYLCTFLLRTAA